MSSPLITRPHTTIENCFEPASLVDLLSWRGAHQAGKTVYTFLSNSNVQEASVTYRDLDLRARAVGAWLQSRGAAGKRVLLLFPSGLDYIAAFFGCLYAKAVAVPAYPPRPNRSLDRLNAIIGDARPVLTLTTGRINSLVGSALDQSPGFESLARQPIEEIEKALCTQWVNPRVSGDTLAFIQYTSGSTAKPKGVMVSHANLLHNEQMIKQAFGQTEESIIVGWLPLFHDMGLIGNVLQPIYLGAECILMSPLTFLQRPFSWLQAISQHRATTSGGPDFAYNLCARKITPEQIETIDLSSWTVAFNGAEQVHKQTMDEFTAAFAHCGFRKEAFYPCYGLAEATLLAAGRGRTSWPAIVSVQRAALDNNRVISASLEDKGVRTLVSSGHAWLDQQIRIIDPETYAECPPNQVGEIWVRGQSVAQGYWGRPEESKRTFQAYLSSTGEGPFLRTGDLGFIKDGELYITGRLKDLIIIRGRNHYPEDIERTVQQSFPGLRPGASAAFSIDIAGQEQLVVVQEIERGYQSRDLEHAIEAISQKIAEAHEIQAYAVVLGKSGCVPKTSSGKVQRHACRKAFLAGSLNAVASRQVATASERRDDKSKQRREGILASDSLERRQSQIDNDLLELAACVLGIEPSGISPHQSLLSLGLDSLKAFELQHRIESNFGMLLPVAGLLQEATISQLASSIATELTHSTSSAAISSVRVIEQAGEKTLSYGQYRLWLVDQLEPGNPAYNISVAFKLAGHLNIFALEQAISEILARHEALRTSFKVVDQQPAQMISPAQQMMLPIVDASTFIGFDVIDLARRESQKPFDLAQDALYRLTLIRLTEQAHTLLISFHHIVSDGWSVGVFLRELAALYESCYSGKESPLPDLPIQYSDFASWQRRWLHGGTLQPQLDYWKQKFAAPVPRLELMADRPRTGELSNRAACHWFILPAELSESLKLLGCQEGATLFMTLLAAFKLILYCHAGQDDITVGSPIAGRNHAKFENLIGFFLNTLALRTDASGNPTIRELLGRVRQVTIEAYTNQDLPFERLVSEVAPDRNPSNSPLYQIWFVLQKEPLPTLNLPRVVMQPVDVDVPAVKVDLSLTLTDSPEGIRGRFEYKKDLFYASTMAGLAKDFQKTLEHMVAQPNSRLSELREVLIQDDIRHQIDQAQRYEGRLRQKLKRIERKVVPG